MKPYNGLHETEGCRALLRDQYKALKVRARRVLGREMRQEIEDYGNGTREEERVGEGFESLGANTECEEEGKEIDKEKETRDSKAENKGIESDNEAVSDNRDNRSSWVWERDGCGLP